MAVDHTAIRSQYDTIWTCGHRKAEIQMVEQYDKGCWVLGGREAKQKMKPEGHRGSDTEGPECQAEEHGLNFMGTGELLKIHEGERPPEVGPKWSIPSLPDQPSPRMTPDLLLQDVLGKGPGNLHVQ